jgi:hypothetical protein
VPDVSGYFSSRRIARELKWHFGTSTSPGSAPPHSTDGVASGIDRRGDLATRVTAMANEIQQEKI